MPSLVPVAMRLSLQAPFFVSLDHVTQSVVVTIRGSISLRDLFTDFTAGADRFEVEGLPPDTMLETRVVASLKCESPESVVLTAEDHKLGGRAARHWATRVKSSGSPSASQGCRSSPGNQVRRPCRDHLAVRQAISCPLWVYYDPGTLPRWVSLHALDLIVPRSARAPVGAGM
uniref:Uncharacterized protein n=1 Tax=Timema bartmani TaxID=61472 RepID=A0A7R9F2K3_9NEOP|nr:unnamed protein product [Timema bartmani]